MPLKITEIRTKYGQIVHVGSSVILAALVIYFSRFPLHMVLFYDVLTNFLRGM